MDQKRVKNASFKKQSVPFGVHKQVKGEHFRPAFSGFNHFTIPETVENGPCCDQKRVKKCLSPTPRGSIARLSGTPQVYNLLHSCG